MARLLRALGLSKNAYDSKQKKLVDTGNVSDTDAEISCSALRKSSGANRKKVSKHANSELDRRPSEKAARASIQSSVITKQIGNEAERSDRSVRQTFSGDSNAVTQSFSSVTKCADVDADYSLPADWRRLENVTADDCNANEAGERDHLARTDLLLQTQVDSGERPYEAVVESNANPPWPVDGASHELDRQQRSNESSLPRVRKPFEPSEQSAFERVRLSDCDNSALHQPQQLYQSINNNNEGDKSDCGVCESEKWTREADCERVRERNQTDKISQLQLSLQLAPVQAAPTERVLPRMGVSAMKARATLASSVSATCGFERQSNNALCNSTSLSFSSVKSNLQSPINCNAAVARTLNNATVANDDSLCCRRHSQNAQDSLYSQRHRSIAEGPYDLPWDERRQRLEALLLSNAGVNLAAVLTQQEADSNASANLHKVDDCNESKSQTTRPAQAAISNIRDCEKVNESQIHKQGAARPTANLSGSQGRRQSDEFAAESVQCQQSFESALASQSQSNSTAESPGARGRGRRKQKSAKRDRPAAHSASPASSASSAQSVSPLALFDNHSSSNDICLLNNPSVAELAEIIDPNLPLDEQSWYFASMTRNTAEKLLQNERTGSFLVRRCETCPQDFSLSIRNDHAQNGIVHMRISRSPKGFILGGFSQPYESVPVLVHHFMFYALPIRGVPSQVLEHPIVGSSLANTN